MPLLKGREGVLKSGLARTVLRFAWHLTTASWVVIAVIMLSIVIRPEALVKSILISTGLLFSIAGMYSAFATKLRHAGWPFLAAVGVCALLAAALLRST